MHMLEGGLGMVTVKSHPNNYSSVFIRQEVHPINRSIGK